jgi:hypothetical protein
MPPPPTTPRSARPRRRGSATREVRPCSSGAHRNYLSIPCYRPHERSTWGRRRGEQGCGAATENVQFPGAQCRCARQLVTRMCSSRSESRTHGTIPVFCSTTNSRTGATGASLASPNLRGGRTNSSGSDYVGAPPLEAKCRGQPPPIGISRSSSYSAAIGVVFIARFARGVARFAPSRCR